MHSHFFHFTTVATHSWLLLCSSLYPAFVQEDKLCGYFWSVRHAMDDDGRTERTQTFNKYCATSVGAHDMSHSQSSKKGTKEKWKTHFEMMNYLRKMWATVSIFRWTFVISHACGTEAKSRMLGSLVHTVSNNEIWRKEITTIATSEGELLSKYFSSIIY